MVERRRHAQVDSACAAPAAVYLPRHRPRRLVQGGAGQGGGCICCRHAAAREVLPRPQQQQLSVQRDDSQENLQGRASQVHGLGWGCPQRDGPDVPAVCSQRGGASSGEEGSQGYNWVQVRHRIDHFASLPAGRPLRVWPGGGRPLLPAQVPGAGHEGGPQPRARALAVPARHVGVGGVQVRQGRPSGGGDLLMRRRPRRAPLRCHPRAAETPTGAAAARCSSRRAARRARPQAAPVQT
mmetsp:Transcript_6416/g.15453  ORF Transcript_6416/g.15453 Transcript_6416/m.15453 type:complete len:239 (+) Transcript_6416:689-1405(+)